MAFHMCQLPILRAVAMDSVQTLSTHEYYLRSVGRPRWIRSDGLSQPPRLSSLNRPEPERHLFVAAGELPDQELRVVGRDGEEACVFKGRRHLLCIAAFHGSLHQIPAAIIAFQKENSRSVGDDSAPLIDPAGVG